MKSSAWKLEQLNAEDRVRVRNEKDRETAAKAMSKQNNNSFTEHTQECRM